MPNLKLRPKAISDLDEIWEYTVHSWGVKQAEMYLKSVDDTFRQLAKKPKLGRAYDEVKEGLFCFPSGKHRVFYFQIKSGIDVVRVLHESMDALGRLQDDEE